MYYSWRWTRTASETCRVIINRVKQKLHLVGYLVIQYFKDARYHEHKILNWCYYSLCGPLLYHGPSCHFVPWVMDQVSIYYSTIRIKIYIASRSIPRRQSGKRRQKIDPAAERLLINDVNNNSSKVKMAVVNFVISKTTQTRWNFVKKKPVLNLSTQPEMLLRKFLVLYRNFNL